MEAKQTNFSGPLRVRFAPSPTGELHIGGVRTALFNWLLARQTGGKFILRIEDTDRERLVEGAIDSIYSSLKWLGIDWDEGPDVGGPHAPYIQSERREFYQAATNHLLDIGKAYECDCSPERLQRIRERQRATSQALGYDGHCRDRSRGDLLKSRSAGNKVVVRARVPRTDNATFFDVIRGRVSFALNTIADYVILKSDGLPTYHLASVIDDHEMNITHVIRAEEWLASTPRHTLLYEWLGYDIPVLAHVPIVLAEDRTKLSKRHGAASTIELRDQGYLPEAVFNFLALLGWSAGDDRELMTLDEIVDSFSLERIKEAPAIFDREKLTWMNGVYIRDMNPSELVEATIPYLEDTESGLPLHVDRPINQRVVRDLIPVIQERMKLLTEAPQMIDLFFEDEIAHEAIEIVPRGKSANGEIMDCLETANVLESALSEIRDFEPFEPNQLEAHFRSLAEEQGLKVGVLFGAIRVAVTGRRIAPPLFDTIALLGRSKCVTRLEDAINALRTYKSELTDHNTSLPKQTLRPK